MGVESVTAGAIKTFEWTELPKGWKFDLLGNVANIRRGASPRPAGDPRYFGGGIPWFKIGDATKSDSRFLSTTETFVNEEGAKHSVRVPPGSLIVSNSGVSLGFAVITKIEGCIHDGWLLLDGLRGAERDYLYYCLNLLTRRIRQMADGTTQPNLNTDIARRLLIPLPPIQQQRAIAHVLSTLDDKIELNRRTNETMEAMARAIFKSWFVDFDPVRAKAEGRQPFGMHSETAARSPDFFQDSALGKIPKEWEVGPILARAMLLGGGTPKTDRNEYWNGDILWASAKDVSQCREAFLVETERTISEQGLAKSATQKISKFSTVVVARGATTGRMVLLGREMTMNQTCYALTSTTNTPFWLYCLIRNEIAQLVHQAHGSVFDTITTSTFNSSMVVLPTARVVEAFEAQVSPFFHKILANARESLTLVAIRDALLPKLISGDLRVKYADGKISEVRT